ncbi:hypothetical protein ACP4OV_012292 [Aristida adscensionis]
MQWKIEVVKCSLLSFVLSNLLLVLHTSLFCGGIANLGNDQPYERKQSDVSTGLLILGMPYQSPPHMLPYAVGAGKHTVATATTGLDLFSACSIVMPLAYGQPTRTDAVATPEVEKEQEPEGAPTDPTANLVSAASEEDDERKNFVERNTFMSKDEDALKEMMPDICPWASYRVKH